MALINPLSVLPHLLTAPQAGCPARGLRFTGHSLAVSRLQITAALLLKWDLGDEESAGNKDDLFCWSI